LEHKPFCDVHELAGGLIAAVECWMAQNIILEKLNMFGTNSGKCDF